jgi:MinD superfamily P-loop ATPase
VSLNKQVLVFPELCHGCGGCWLVCPTGAITEAHRQTGRVDLGQAGRVQFVQGLVNVGEAMSPPAIRAVKQAAPEADLVVIDVPSGTSCPVIESIRDADFVLLVTEPTPFGLHDLKLAVEVVRALGLPFGVVINRADVGDDETGRYCQGERIDVLAEIPDDRRVAEAYSRGEIAYEAIPEYRGTYDSLLKSVTERTGTSV